MPDVNSLVIKFREVKYAGASIFKHNILFLSEGFSVAEEEKFDKAVSKIVQHFLNIPPFCMTNDQDKSSLKDCFNFFKVFTPSPSSGITIEVPLNDEGEPRLSDSPNPSFRNRMAVKDSALGLAYKVMGIGLVPLEKTEYVDFIQKVIATLRFSGEEPSKTAIPQCWLEPSDTPYSGKDNGLVCVLVNDTYHQAYATPMDSFKKVVITLYKDKFFTMTPDKADHVVPTGKWIDCVQLANTLAHEFGHTFFRLGDEYVNKGYSENKQKIEHYLNLVHHDTLSSPSKDFPDVSIKWLADLRLTDRCVNDYMVQNKKPLRQYRQGDGTQSNQEPDQMFLNRHKHPFPPDIIGLYQGADFSFTKVYRPAGRCRMRGSSSVHKDFIGVPLERLPMDIERLEDTSLYYLPEQKLLLCGIIYMEQAEKQRLLGLADPASDPDTYSQYKQAVEMLYEISNDDTKLLELLKRFIFPFCLVCKYHIVMKLTENFTSQKREGFIQKLFASIPPVRKRV